jgi:hypothetical protein
MIAVEVALSVSKYPRVAQTALFRAARQGRRHAEDNWPSAAIVPPTRASTLNWSNASVDPIFPQQFDLGFRPDCLEKFHAYRREQEKGPFAFRVTRGRRYSGGLGERFRQDHARHNRVAGKMTREHRIVRAEKHPRFYRPAGSQRTTSRTKQRRTMGKTKKVTVT